MNKFTIIKQVAKDIASLADPKTATALVGLAIVLIGPALGWHPDAAVKDSIIGAVVAVGIVVGYVEKQIAVSVNQARLNVVTSLSARTCDCEDSCKGVPGAICKGLTKREPLEPVIANPPEPEPELEPSVMAPEAPEEPVSNPPEPEAPAPPLITESKVVSG